MGAFHLGSADTYWVYYILVPVVGILTGGPSNIISSAIAADLAQTPSVSGDEEALATVTGIIDGTGGFGAALGQTLIGLIATVSWDMVFVFLMSEAYLGIGLTAILTMSPIVCREYGQFKAIKQPQSPVGFTVQLALSKSS
jgi:sugar phosphate permease